MYLESMSNSPAPWNPQKHATSLPPFTLCWTLMISADMWGGIQLKSVVVAIPRLHRQKRHWSIQAFSRSNHFCNLKVNWNVGRSCQLVGYASIEAGHAHGGPFQLSLSKKILPPKLQSGIEGWNTMASGQLAVCAVQYSCHVASLRI